jgi:protein kinase/serine/threonine-protein kinase
MTTTDGSDNATPEDGYPDPTVMSQSSRSDPEPGDVLEGRYELQSALGDGGFSKVWKALDKQTGDIVAIKSPNYDSQNNPRTVEEYFDREVDALEDLKSAGGHPNVMGLHETFSANGTIYMVTEFIDGELLEDAGSVGSPDEARRIAIQLCDIFSFLHEHEIIYRDLKPDNMMLTPDGEPKLIDFNTARERPKCPNCDSTITYEQAGKDYCPSCGEQIEEETLLGGSDRYKAVEQGQNQGRQGPWTDVYALGKILFFLLDGFTPREDSVNPQHYNVQCPDALAQIIERATALDPPDRYRNAIQMRQALEDMDPTPASMKAVIENLGSGEQIEVFPGDTIGRKNQDGPFATIELEDEDGYVSRVHATFEYEQGQWVLRDTSTNGTFIHKGDDWYATVSRSGYQYNLRIADRDIGDVNGAPPERRALHSGDVITFVDPDYDQNYDHSLQFEFKQ